MIPVQNQVLDESELLKLMEKVALENFCEHPFGNYRAYPKGVDLGSRQFRTLKPQKVAVLVGDGVNAYDAGEIWHLLDTRYAMTITKLELDDVARTDISGYTDIIAPAFWGGGPDPSVTENWKLGSGRRNTLSPTGVPENGLTLRELLKMKFKTQRILQSHFLWTKEDYNGAQVIEVPFLKPNWTAPPYQFWVQNDRLALFRNTTLFVEADKNSYNNPIQYTSNPFDEWLHLKRTKPHTQYGTL